VAWLSAHRSTVSSSPAVGTASVLAAAACGDAGGRSHTDPLKISVGGQTCTRIHGGILAIRDDRVIRPCSQAIPLIDLVGRELYPFVATVPIGRGLGAGDRNIDHRRPGDCAAAPRTMSMWRYHPPRVVRTVSRPPGGGRL